MVKHNMEKPHVCIVGGGVIGIACAHYLLSYGYQVTLVDKQSLGQEASKGNCGFIHHHSHVLPLAQPGVILTVLKMMLTHGWNAPVYIQPQILFSIRNWLWQFYRNCSSEMLHQNVMARVALLNSSCQLYRELLRSQKFAYRWHEKGSLIVFENQAQLEQARVEHESLHQEFGLEYQWLNGETLLDVEPNLKSNLAGGIYFASDAHLQPDLLIKAWIDVLKQNGVVIRENCNVEELICENGQAQSIITSSGKISADHFVFATGAFTSQLQDKLQCELPILPGKGYSLSLSYSSSKPTIPIVFPEKNMAITPMDDYLRLGSIMELVGYNKKLHERRFSQLKSSIGIYYKNLQHETVVEKWCGLRPMTPDGVPYIGACPSMKNVFVAAGHNMEGLTLAPATGKLIAEMIADEKPHVDPVPYRIGRNK
jgi:D-amino-acid dehydrogenase